MDFSFFIINNIFKNMLLGAFSGQAGRTPNRGEMRKYARK